jgi:hypothetical protein
VRPEAAMTPAEPITIASAIIGMMLGTAGFVISLFNYLRDRPNVRVCLNWDWKVTDSLLYDPTKYWGIVSVTNVGRRPVFITSVALRLPKRYTPSWLLLGESIPGKKLSEGDPPATFMSTQERMEEYSGDWRKIRAVAFDSAGKRYISKPVRARPSWAH